MVAFDLFQCAHEVLTFQHAGSQGTGQASRGKTRYLPCIGAGFTKCPPVADVEGAASTCPLAPGASRLISGFCSSPRSFGLGIPGTHGEK
jgi:hypothetical protein